MRENFTYGLMWQGMEKYMENLNGHEAGNGGNRQGDTYSNSPFLDPTLICIFEQVAIFLILIRHINILNLNS